MLLMEILGEFEAYDMDGSGTISAEELGNLLTTKIGIDLPDGAAENIMATLGAGVQHAHEHVAGTLDLHEFNLIIGYIECVKRGVKIHGGHGHGSKSADHQQGGGQTDATENQPTGELVKQRSRTLTGATDDQANEFQQLLFERDEFESTAKQLAKDLEESRVEVAVAWRALSEPVETPQDLMDRAGMSLEEIFDGVLKQNAEGTFDSQAKAVDILKVLTKMLMPAFKQSVEKEKALSVVAPAAGELGGGGPGIEVFDMEAEYEKTKIEFTSKIALLQEEPAEPESLKQSAARAEQLYSLLIAKVRQCYRFNMLQCIVTSYDVNIRPVVPRD